MFALVIRQFSHQVMKSFGNCLKNKRLYAVYVSATFFKSCSNPRLNLRIIDDYDMMKYSNITILANFRQFITVENVISEEAL